MIDIITGVKGRLILRNVSLLHFWLRLKLFFFNLFILKLSYYCVIFRLDVLTTMALSRDEVIQEHAVEALAELLTIPSIQVGGHAYTFISLPNGSEK